VTTVSSREDCVARAPPLRFLDLRADSRGARSMINDLRVQLSRTEAIRMRGPQGLISVKPHWLVCTSAVDRSVLPADNLMLYLDGTVSLTDIVRTLRDTAGHLWTGSGCGRGAYRLNPSQLGITSLPEARTAPGAGPVNPRRTDLPPE
jgi:hypothetical protein